MIHNKQKASSGKRQLVLGGVDDQHQQQVKKGFYESFGGTKSKSMSRYASMRANETVT